MRLLKILGLSLALLPHLSAAKILRSAGLYYSPDQQIEANVVAAYNSSEHSYGVYQTNSSYSTLGGRFEHGMNEHFSWGSQLLYGSGENQIKSSVTKTKTSAEGLLDPEFFLKAHYDTENARFHANAIASLKSDAKVENYDRSPVTFSTGGSALAVQLGAETALGPTIIGSDLRADLWKDTQEVVNKNINDIDTVYFRDGGKSYSLSVFAELTNLTKFKPGIKLRATQIDESNSSIQENQKTVAGTPSSYRNPKLTQLGGSLYGRVRLPGHFVLNFEIYGADSSSDENSNSRHNTNFGLISNVGFKF